MNFSFYFDACELGDFYKPDSDANQFRLGSSILIIIFFQIQYIFDNFFFQSVQIYTRDAACAETNEKSIVRFLFFEIWSFLYSKYGQFPMKNSKHNSNKEYEFFFSSFIRFTTIWTKKSNKPAVDCVVAALKTELM